MRLAPRTQAKRCSGFTLVELLVAMGILALMTLMSWRGLDSMVRTEAALRERTRQVMTLQTGLAQWNADLEALVVTSQVRALDFDGRTLRLTRRDATLADTPVRVVAWTRRLLPDRHAGAGSLVRWQSPPVRTLGELQQAWGDARIWAQDAPAALVTREVPIVGIQEWQIFYFRGNGWSNPQSGASNELLEPLPDAVRLRLMLAPGQALQGVVVKDWIRLAGDS